MNGQLRNKALEILDYQPFIIDDDHCTGVGYTWLHAPDPRFVGPDGGAMRYSKTAMPAAEWDKALEGTKLLSKTYDSIIAEAARLCPGGSFLDISCNNGYFPVQASLMGMKNCAGIDPLDRSECISLLNEITGQKTTFMQGGYIFWHHVMARFSQYKYKAKRNKWWSIFKPSSNRISLNDQDVEVMDEKYDVVTNSGFMCHVGEPLHFLYATSSLAKKVFIIYSGFLDDDDYMIRYNPPQKFIHDHFPSCFNDGTAISIKLFKESMQQLGFSQIYELPQAADGMPPDWHLRRMPRYGRWTVFICIR